MHDESEITIKEVWPKLCELGLVELRINGYTVWSDHVLDCMFGREDYSELTEDYRKRAEEELLSELYDSFRVTSMSIQVVEFHHIIADVVGYYEDCDIRVNDAETITFRDIYRELDNSRTNDKDQ